MDPQQLRYSETHEWANLDGEICTVGLTTFAVEQLGDLVHLELPEIGKTVTSGADFGVIESYKSANDLYAPVEGEVVEVNDRLTGDDFTVLSTDPLGEGWLIKLKVAAGTSLDHLKTHEQYQEQIESGRPVR